MKTKECNCCRRPMLYSFLVDAYVCSNIDCRNHVFTREHGEKVQLIDSNTNERYFVMLPKTIEEVKTLTRKTSK